MWMHKSVVMPATFVCVVCISIYSFSRFIFIYFQRGDALPKTKIRTHTLTPPNESKARQNKKSRRRKSKEYKIKWNPFVVWFDGIAVYLLLFQRVRRWFYHRKDFIPRAAVTHCRHLRDSPALSLSLFSILFACRFENKGSFLWAARMPELLQCCLFKRQNVLNSIESIY